MGSHFGTSVTASIEDKELVVTEVYPDELPMFETEKEEIDNISTLSRWEKKLLKQSEESYFKFNRSFRKNLDTVCGILLSLCDEGLRNRLRSESEFQDMIKSKKMCNEIVSYN